MMRVRVGLLLAALCLPMNVSAEARVFLLGDSLSDTGNHAIVRRGIQPGYASPGVGYREGRSSNGPVWIERLLSGYAVYNMWGLEALPEFTDTGRQGGQLLNYAVAGATSGEYAVFNIPSTFAPVSFHPFGLLSQFARMQYQLEEPGGGDMLVIWIGKNDLSASLQSLRMPWWLRTLAGWSSPMPLLSAEQQVSSTLANLGEVLRRADAWGFRRIVVLTQIGGGEVPYQQWSRDRYRTAIASLNGGMPGAIGRELRASVTLIDVSEVAEAASSRGAVDVSRPCQVDGATCDAPDAHFYWDASHPSARGHDLIAAWVRPQWPQL